MIIKLVETGRDDLPLRVGHRRSSGTRSTAAPWRVTRSFAKQDTEYIIRDTMSEKVGKAFKEEGELAFSYTVTGVDRFRVNAFRRRGSVSVLVRFIPLGVPRFEDLNLSGVIGRLTRAGRGINLLRGPPAVVSSLRSRLCSTFQPG